MTNAVDSFVGLQGVTYGQSSDGALLLAAVDDFASKMDATGQHDSLVPDDAAGACTAGRGQ